MSFKIIITSILLITFSNLYSQDNIAKLEVNYNMTYIPDSLNLDNKMQVNLTLLCNENKSVYFSRDTKLFYQNISKKVGEMKDGSLNLGKIPAIPKVKGVVYRDETKITANLPVGEYIYSFEEPKLNWILLNDSKTINGMKCSLAKVKIDTGDTFYAWYTQQYTFSEGPFRFKGLPGLIVEVHNQNKTIIIEASEIKKSYELIESYTFGNIVTLKSKEEFIKARLNYDPNANKFRNNEIIITDSKGTDYSKRANTKSPTINVFLD